MVVKFTRDNIAEAAFFSKYLDLKDIFYSIDAHRARGLGDDGLRIFIRHVITVTDRLKLNLEAEVSYVMFIMMHLGSHFLGDPRYRKISDIFYQNVNGVDRRISQVRSEFIDVAETTIGSAGKAYLSATKSFSEFIKDADLNRNISEAEMFDILNGAYKYKLPHHLSEGIKKNGEIASRKLNADSQEGINTCAYLSFWLGFGFFDDPLFPWVREIGSQSRDSAYRASALRNYAIKRLDKQIQIMEKRDV